MVNLEDGSTQAILSRFPEHRQRNVALMPGEYSVAYIQAMASCIKLVGDHYALLKAQGETDWNEPPAMTAVLDELAAVPPYPNSYQ